MLAARDGAEACATRTRIRLERLTLAGGVVPRVKR